MKINEIEKLELPDIEVGDEVKVGKFKNRKAEVKGFKKDKNNHPVLKTDKGDQAVFKPRITKLIKEKIMKTTKESMRETLDRLNEAVPPYKLIVKYDKIWLINTFNLTEILGMIGHDDNGMEEAGTQLNNEINGILRTLTPSSSSPIGNTSERLNIYSIDTIQAKKLINAGTFLLDSDYLDDMTSSRYDV